MGLSVKQAMFAVRKYKSHRRLPGNVLEEVERMIPHASEKRQAAKVAESKHRARAERKATKQAKMAVVIAE